MQVGGNGAASGEEVTLLEYSVEHDPRQELSERMRMVAQRDPQIMAAFLTGSSARQSENRFSDIDMWLVVDEPVLSHVLPRIEAMIGGVGCLWTSHWSTPMHVTAIYADLVVLDLNIVTAAVFASLHTGDVRTLFDRRGNMVTPELSFTATEEGALIVRGYGLLTRVASKIEAGHYWIIPRFINGLRDEIILPLLAARFGWNAAYPRREDLDALPSPVRTLIEETFAPPNAVGSRQAATAALRLLRELSELPACDANQGRKALIGREVYTALCAVFGCDENNDGTNGRA